MNLVTTFVPGTWTTRNRGWTCCTRRPNVTYKRCKRPRTSRGHSRTRTISSRTRTTSTRTGRGTTRRDRIWSTWFAKRTTYCRQVCDIVVGMVRSSFVCAGRNRVCPYGCTGPVCGGGGGNEQGWQFYRLKSVEERGKVSYVPSSNKLKSVLLVDFFFFPKQVILGYAETECLWTV